MHQPCAPQWQPSIEWLGKQLAILNAEISRHAAMTQITVGADASRSHSSQSSTGLVERPHSPMIPVPRYSSIPTIPDLEDTYQSHEIRPLRAQTLSHSSKGQEQICAARTKYPTAPTCAISTSPQDNQTSTPILIPQPVYAYSATQDPNDMLFGIRNFCSQSTMKQTSSLADQSPTAVDVDADEWYSAPQSPSGHYGAQQLQRGNSAEQGTERIS